MRNSNRRLSRFLMLPFFMIIVAQQPVRSQELKGQKNPEYPQKKWQLKFSMGPNLMPLQFDGFKIYLQRKTSGNKAVRFGIGLRDYNRDSKHKFHNIYPADDYYREIDLDSDQLMLSTAIDFIGYIKSGTTIKPYFGIGSFFEYSLISNDQKSWQDGSQSNAQTYIEERKILDTGFTAILGAEWRLSGLLILQVEYSLRFYYESIRTDASLKYPLISPGFIRENTRDFDYYRVDAGYVKTGFSIVF